MGKMMIFQTFELNTERINSIDPNCKLDPKRLEDEILRAALHPKNRTPLLEGLAEKGYQVLEGMTHICGIPATVIVGGEFGRDIKGDFSEIVAKLHLPYRSGLAYTSYESAKDKK